jgi:hypothetical protein
MRKSNPVRDLPKWNIAKFIGTSQVNFPKPTKPSQGNPRKCYSNISAVLGALLGGIELQRTLLVSHAKEKAWKFLTMHLTCFAHGRNDLHAPTQVDLLPWMTKKNVLTPQINSNLFIKPEKWRVLAHLDKASNGRNRHTKTNQFWSRTTIICSNHSAAAKRSGIFQKVI